MRSLGGLLRKTEGKSNGTGKEMSMFPFLRWMGDDVIQFDSSLPSVKLLSTQLFLGRWEFLWNYL